MLDGHTSSRALRWRLSRALCLCGAALLLAMSAYWFASARLVRVALATRALGLTTQRQPPDSRPAQASVVSAPVTESPRVTLGRAFFFDAELSEPPGTSCGTCHNPSQAYAGDNGSELGTPRGSRPGHYARRNTPSLLYLRFVRRRHVVWDDDGDRPEVFGGFFWDGRADHIADLVREPLLNPDEMANRDLHQIALKLRRSPEAAALAAEFDDVFASDEKTLEALGLCLEAFLTSRPLSPFTSKYDDFVRKTATLSPLELRGLALFKDPDKGACSACHRLDETSGLPESSLFSDFGYDAVGVPRNRGLPANRDPRHFDLGLCERRSPRLHTDDAWFCGSFRTPSLRNVGLRGHFMHNGRFSSLREVVSFYATRATDPARWYGATTFDDLPPQYRENVNVSAPPYNQPQGEVPRLSESDVDAIVAFLLTLTDREIPPGP